MSDITTAPQPVPEGTPQTPVDPTPIPLSAIDRRPGAVPTPYSGSNITVSRPTTSTTVEVIAPPEPIVPNIPPPASIAVLDEGTLLTGAVRSFNFTGDGVVATANTQTNAVTVLITGGNVATFYGNANVAAYLASGTNTSNIRTTGNVSGSYILGNGSQLTGISTGSSNTIFNGTSNVTIPTADGNVTINAGNGNQWIFGTNGILTLAGGATLKEGVTLGALALGYQAGATSQGIRAVAIGQGAGQT